jgi:hypothetical protein
VDWLCNAQQYERSEARRDTRAGHYERGPQTKAGEIRLRIPKLRRQSSRRRESSVEEASDRQVGLGAPDRGHHRGFLEHASVTLDGIGPEQEDLLDDRGLAQSPDRGRAPVCLSRRHRIALAESAAEFFPEAAWQRCVVHWYRNIFSHVPSTKVREIVAILRAIHAGEDIAAAREKAIRVIDNLRALRLARAPNWWKWRSRRRSPTTPSEEHWRRIRSNNPLERILREMRRRTRVVGAFPDGSICAQPRRRQATPHRRHGVVDEEIPEHRAAEGPADERCHHRVSQGVPLSQTENAKDFGHYLRLQARSC